MSNSVNFAQLYDDYEKEDKIEGVPVGTYVLEVTSAKNVGAKSYIQPIYRIAEGPLAGKKVMAGTLSYTEKARSIFFQKLEGFGLTKEFFLSGATPDDVARALVGRVVRVELGVQTDGQYAGRNELPIRGITLVSAPALPGLGGTPAVVPPPAPPAAPQTPPPAAPAAVPPPPPPTEPAVAVAQQQDASLAPPPPPAVAVDDPGF